MDKLIIFGTGVLGQLAHDYFTEFSKFKVVAFACEKEFVEGNKKFGLPLVVLEDLEELFPPQSYSIFVAIGYTNMNRERRRVYEILKQKGYSFPSFVYPGIKIWPSTQIGENVFIFEDNTIQPYTNIGNNIILWSGNHIGHHSSIGHHSFLSSHVVISGNCNVGQNVFFGVNSTVHDGVVIQDFAMIGSSATVTKDVPEKGVLIQSPTKLFPRNSDRIGV